jgi:hypothetical protein
MIVSPVDDESLLSRLLFLDGIVSTTPIMIGEIDCWRERLVHNEIDQDQHDHRYSQDPAQYIFSHDSSPTEHYVTIKAMARK